jgi:hypothetical protein|tara:strand:- start:380 stop:625 length:246 start_codon:yes stop_codon:yes gene_type:complete
VKIRNFNIEEYIESKTLKFRQKVRDSAVKKAENNLIKYGRLQTDLTPDEWENLVYEEENEIWDKYKKGSITTIIALAFWLP